MVRIIVGSLVNIGLGKWEINEINNILKAKDRTKAGQTAPAQGLFLQEIIFGSQRAPCTVSFLKQNQLP